MHRFVWSCWRKKTKKLPDCENVWEREYFLWYDKMNFVERKRISTHTHTQTSHTPTHTHTSLGDREREIICWMLYWGSQGGGWVVIKCGEWGRMFWKYLCVCSLVLCDLVLFICCAVIIRDYLHQSVCPHKLPQRNKPNKPTNNEERDGNKFVQHELKQKLLACAGIGRTLSIYC